jgi:hypothetical protein
MVGKRIPERFTLKNERQVIAMSGAWRDRIGDRREIRHLRQNDRAESQGSWNLCKKWWSWLGKAEEPGRPRGRDRAGAKGQ